MKDHHSTPCRKWIVFACVGYLLFNACVAFSADDGDVTLSLHEADIQDLVRWASSVTNKTIIIHPAVKGSVTVVAGEPITRDEAYRVFLSVLQVHGFAVINAGKALKVVPANIGKEDDVSLLSEGSRSPDDIVVRIIKVKNIAANDVMALVKPMLPQSAHLASYPGTNTLLIASRASKVAQISEIIKRLDQAGTIDIEMIAVKYASALDLSQTLTKLIPASTSSGQPHPTSLAVDERSNSILMTGDPVSRKQIRALIQRLDQPLAGDGNTQVIFLQYARATQLVAILESVSGSLTKAEKDQRLAQADISIRADESLNSLIITAPPSVLSTIKGVIAKLDVRRAQVLVEALIVEVNEDRSRDLGVEWRSNYTDGEEESIFGGFSSFPGAVSPFEPDASGEISLGRGLSLGYFRGTDLRSIIRALEGDASANILSKPSILAMDNEEAKILVGENVPFITGSQNRQGDLDPFQTIQRQDIGVVLKIKPHINNSDSVTLQVDHQGQTLLEVESADISALSENWQWPEPVKLMAADGKTDIYGLLFRPSDFSPDKRYPVINFINSGPWLSVVPKGSFHTSRGYAERHYFYSAAMAELGFIVLNLDSRGSPLRSKAFLDESYGWIPASANTDDHAGAIQQLAQRYPYMDINRVGICTQLYGSGLQNFLERQDLYKVCVQMSLLDNRLIGCTIEGDKWEGINGPSTDKYHYPEVLVNQLKGKLMLMQSITSPVSTAYPSTATFRVVEALQKANKAFEMLMIPGSPSGSPCSGYMTRRGWDFLVKHLLKATPPTAFELIDMKMSSADK